MITRRQFIGSTGGGLFLTAWPELQAEADLASLGNIVVIMLEGGLDGLAAVPPTGDPDLGKRRKHLVPGNLIKLSSLFSLHPALKNYAAMLSGGNAAIVHATSIPYTLRSHFEGQNLMQTGSTVPFSHRSGWLGRAMALVGVPGRALSLGMPLLVRGEGDLDTHYPADIRGATRPNSKVLQLLETHHGGGLSQAFNKLREKDKEQMESSATSVAARRRDTEGLAYYAGQKLSEPMGPHVAVITVPGFDTHALQGADEGVHPRLLRELDTVFESFRLGLGEAWSKTIILTLTEFGRTVEENGSAGTDHGYGTCGLLAGGLLKQARVVSKWPGLGKSDLFERRDLQSTLDYRSVCAACIGAAFGLDHDVVTERVFGEKTLLNIAPLLFS